MKRRDATSLSPKDRDSLIREFADAGETIRQLQKRRRQIIERLPNGRLEGETLAICRKASHWETVVSIKDLRERVSAAIMSACSTRKLRGPTAMVVPKKAKAP